MIEKFRRRELRGGYEEAERKLSGKERGVKGEREPRPVNVTGLSDDRKRIKDELRKAEEKTEGVRPKEIGDKSLEREPKSNE